RQEHKREEEEEEEEEEIENELVNRIKRMNMAPDIVDMKEYNDEAPQLECDIEEDLQPTESDEKLDQRLHQWCQMWLVPTDDETELQTFRRMRQLFGATRDTDVLSNSTLKPKYLTLVIRLRSEE